MDFILIAAALAPAFLLLWYVYQKDKVEREPIGLIVRMFLLGALTGPIAAIIENILFGLFESIIPPGTFLIVVEFFIGVAAVEEGLKYLALSTIRKNPNFNYVFDGVVYGVAVALGFAALENVLYVLEGGLGVALTRAILSVPGHCADGVVMGVFFGLARHYEVRGVKSTARLYYWLAFLLPTIEHGIYDTGLSLDNDFLALGAMAFGLAFIIFAMVLVNKMAKQDKAIYGATNTMSHAQITQWQQQPIYPAQQPGAVPPQQYPQQVPVQPQYPQQPYAQPQPQYPQQPYGQQPYQQQAPGQQPYQPQAQPQQYPQQNGPTVRYSSQNDQHR